MIDQLNNHGINITSTGGETADIGDLVKTIVVDSTVIGRIKRNQIINNKNITEGNVIVGLASFGKSSYEKNYNSGIGSNGLTSARHDVFNSLLKNKYPESFDNSIQKELIYSGSKTIFDKIDGLNMNIGELILSPTRTYAPVVKKILEKIPRDRIKGMIHCTGGGQTKILHFIDKNHVIKDNLFDIPPVFKLIQNESGTDWRDMYQVFNMGHRLEFYLDVDDAKKIIDISNSFNIDAKIIGKVEKANKKNVIDKIGQRSI